MADQAGKDRFVAALAKLGGSAGNGKLRDTLGWDQATYDTVKAALLAEGAIAPGRGRGGSVTLVGVKGGADLALDDLFPELDQPAPKAAKEPAPAKSARTPKAKAAGNGGDLGIEGELVKTADKLRGNMEPSDYKHVALGLIFLKHISWWR